MRSLYDALGIGGAGSPAIVALVPGTTQTTTGAAVDTKGFQTGVLVGNLELGANPSTTVSTVGQVTLTECATSGGSYTNANDNTGSQIGFTLNLWNGTTGKAVQNLARIEGLGQNRKRYLQATLGVTNSGSQTVNGYAEILLSRAYSQPVNTAVSNT